MGITTCRLIQSPFSDHWCAGIDPPVRREVKRRSASDKRSSISATSTNAVANTSPSSRRTHFAAKIAPPSACFMADDCDSCACAAKPRPSYNFSPRAPFPDAHPPNLCPDLASFCGHPPLFLPHFTCVYLLRGLVCFKISSSALIPYHSAPSHSSSAVLLQGNGIYAYAIGNPSSCPALRSLLSCLHSCVIRGFINSSFGPSSALSVPL